MRQNIAEDLILKLVDYTKRIKAGDHSVVESYLSDTKYLNNLKLDRAEIFMLRNKMTNIKALMPMLEDLTNQKIILTILNCLNKPTANLV